jgi:hypothetical protein
MRREYTSFIRTALYTAACLAVPAVWAVIMFKVFELVRRASPRKKPDKDPPIDYMI